MKVTCLGTGTPEAWARRASSGYLVDAGDETVLFDCGGGVVDRLLSAGRRPSDVDRLFFSHLHSDHMIDFPRLAHARWDEGGGDIDVMGPAPLAEIARRCFGRDGWLAHDLVARTEHPASQKVWLDRGGALPRPWPSPRVVEIAPGFVAEGAGWRLTSCRVPHAQPQLECMAFRIEAGGRSLVYSGDSGVSADLEALAADADLLIHWCYRWSWESLHPALDDLAPGHEEIAALAERAGVKRLALTHLRAHMDAPGDHARALSDMGALYSGTTAIAEDLMEFHL